MDRAIKTRSLDMHGIARICDYHVSSTVLSIVLEEINSRVDWKLSMRVRRQFSLYGFMAYARLDLQTFQRPEVQRDLRSVSDVYVGTTVWHTLKSVTDLVGTGLRLSTQAYALFNVLKGQPDGLLMATFALGLEVLPLLWEYRDFAFTSGELTLKTTQCPFSQRT